MGESRVEVEDLLIMVRRTREDHNDSEALGAKI